MPPWAYALIFVAVLCAIGGCYDYFARRKRRGLEKYGSPGSGDPVGQVERTRPGTTGEATGIHGGGPSGL